MLYKVVINDSNYSQWTLVTEDGTASITSIDVSNFNPLERKLFTEDIIDDEYNIISSPIRDFDNIPGILLTTGKTYGRSKQGKGKFYYKCIPNNRTIPAFLISYEQKTAGFNKNTTNQYVLFKYKEWTGKHPIGVLTNHIGAITNLEKFYEYQLHCRNLFISIKDFTNATNRSYKTLSNTTLVNEILDKYPNIEDRSSADIISIDPENSIDFDDAIGISGNILSIYIANVPLILDCLNLWDIFSDRISTIYLPDRKYPMLPPLLSDNLCSLLENEIRPTFCMDIEFNGGEITDIMLKNVLIKVKKNYRYDDSMLAYNAVYKLILPVIIELNKTYKYLDNIRDSHDVVAYLMILMNCEIAQFLEKFETGIYRTLALNAQADSKTSNITEEVSNFIRIWNSNSGQYCNYTEKTGHALIGMGVDSYVHITSPIRRLVDLLNMMNIQKCLGLVTTTKEATMFYQKWVNKLDHINQVMKNIRKTQIECNLLHLCTTQPHILDKLYLGYIVDKVTMEDHLWYTVYIPSIKIITQLRIKDELELYSSQELKLYLFQDGITLKRKIRATLVQN